MLLPAIYLPVISPDIVSVEVAGFNLAIRWYAMAYVLGFIIGWLWLVSLVKRPALWCRNTPPALPGQLEVLLTWIIIGTVAGGRLGYVFLYQPQFFLQNPEQILMIWSGGMSFHGGLMGNAIAVILFCRFNRIAILPILDGVSIVVTPGLFMGRLANLINAELYGRPTELPWAIVFPTGPAAICPGHWQALCSRHPSQLYEALLEGLLLGGIMIWCAYRAGWLKTPGRITGLFIAGYGTARFLVEFFRQADAHYISPDNPLGHVLRLSEGIGLSIGQSLSLPMIVAGLILVYYANSRSRRRA